MNIFFFWVRRLRGTSSDTRPDDTRTQRRKIIAASRRYINFGGTGVETVIGELNRSEQFARLVERSRLIAHIASRSNRSNSAGRETKHLQLLISTPTIMLAKSQLNIFLYGAISSATQQLSRLVWLWMSPLPTNIMAGAVDFIT